MCKKSKGQGHFLKEVKQVLSIYILWCSPAPGFFLGIIF